MLEHIERLKAWQALDLPTGIERLVHQNRLLKIAREGRPDDTRRRPNSSRNGAAPLVALATVTDEIIDLHDRIRVSCLTLPRISISSSSGRQARPSTPRYVCTGASVRR
ncbi:hypothetical protein ECZU29_61940 [Escherichia coli]|nr:hypothetical protein ECZU29_61940 [Escherichia coli]